MSKIEDISVLTVDGVTYAVASCSDEVKALVDVYNKWNREEAEAYDKFIMIRHAKETLSNKIVTQLQHDVTMDKPVVAEENVFEEKESAVDTPE